MMVDDEMMIEVVICPRAFVTLRALVLLIRWPDSAGLARRIAATEEVARRAVRAENSSAPRWRQKGEQIGISESPSVASCRWL